MLQPASFPTSAPNLIRAGVDFNIGNMSGRYRRPSGQHASCRSMRSAAPMTPTPLAQEINADDFPDRRILASTPTHQSGSRVLRTPPAPIVAILELPAGSAISRRGPILPVRDRVACCAGCCWENGRGEVRLQQRRSCKRTIECLELQSYTEQGDPDKDGGLRPHERQPWATSCSARSQSSRTLALVEAQESGLLSCGY